MPPKLSAAKRRLNARPDTLDFRDTMYVPTLIEVLPRIPLERYLEAAVPILDQGQEGACTGFGLATVAHYLLRRRTGSPDTIDVSPRMLYELAKRYDGSSARGAMKGWHKHGVCSEKNWPYQDSARDVELYAKRWSDALRRPLGAYYRVNHRDLVAMHSAIAEVEILYATATVHEGWDNVAEDGVIPLKGKKLGGHAFAIVAYDERGFWIQNSWSEEWGQKGFALITYDDWLANSTDVWVARLGAPIVLSSPESTAVSFTAAARGSRSYAFCDLRPHVISIGNEGRLRTHGDYGTGAEDVATIFERSIPRITEKWSKRRILLYAHGGLVSEQSAVQRLADLRPALLEAEVYPISFIWKTDYWTTITNILQDALHQRRPEGAIDNAKDFMLDRLDDALEPVARMVTGKAAWDEMRENALAATMAPDGGARLALQHLAQLLADDPDERYEIHLCAHSAGSIFFAPVAQHLTGGEIRRERPVATCTLWAPACTIALFKKTYLPAIRDGSIERFALFTLTDETERDDNCADIYHKSLLYLVSNAFGSRPRIPGFRDGVPILGMEKFVRASDELQELFTNGRAQWVRSPNIEPVNSPGASRAQHHGDFDDDQATLRATLARLGARVGAGGLQLHASAAGQRARRAKLTNAAG